MASTPHGALSQVSHLSRLPTTRPDARHCTRAPGTGGEGRCALADLRPVPGAAGLRAPLSPLDGQPGCARSPPAPAKKPVPTPSPPCPQQRESAGFHREAGFLKRHFRVFRTAPLGLLLPAHPPRPHGPEGSGRRATLPFLLAEASLLCRPPAALPWPGPVRGRRPPPSARTPPCSPAAEGGDTRTAVACPPLPPQPAPAASVPGPRPFPRCRLDRMRVSSGVSANYPCSVRALNMRLAFPHAALHLLPHQLPLGGTDPQGADFSR